MAYRQLYETSRPCSALAYRKHFPVAWKAVLSFIYQGDLLIVGEHYAMVFWMFTGQ